MRKWMGDREVPKDGSGIATPKGMPVPAFTFRLGEAATIYFVAMVMTKPDGSHVQCTEVFVVSGRTPLTREEAIGRFHRMQEEHWSESEYGPRGSWVPGATVVQARELWGS